MTRRLRNLRAARKEFIAAVRRYEQQRVGLGGEFFDAVAGATARVQTDPEIGPPISPDQRTRRLFVPRFPYQIVYRLLPNEIVIVAVAHLKRRPGYWKEGT